MRKNIMIDNKLIRIFYQSVYQQSARNNSDYKILEETKMKIYVKFGKILIKLKGNIIIKRGRFLYLKIILAYYPARNYVL